MCSIKYSQLLEKRVSKQTVDLIANEVCQDQANFEYLYSLIDSDEDMLSWHALWVCEVLAKKDKSILINKAKDLEKKLLVCQHFGKQRLLLNILLKLQLLNPISVPLLNYCFYAMLDPSKPVAVQSVAMKMAFKICKLEPELLPELQCILQNAVYEYFQPSTKTTAKNILREMLKLKVCQNKI